MNQAEALVEQQEMLRSIASIERREEAVSERGATDQRWVALALLCVSQFMLILDGSIVNVALPSMQQSLGFSPEHLQWVVTTYTLAFGGFLLVGGRLTDLFGRRVFFIGLGLFTLASLLGGLAQSPSWLIAARAAQGLGGAIVTPAVLPSLAKMFAEGPERRRALGIFGAVNASGFSVGALLGGLLTGVAGWRSIFFVNVPIGIVVMLLALPLLPKSPRVPRQLDLPGAFLVTSGSTLLVYAISEATSVGRLAFQALGSLLAALVLLGCFVIVETRTKEPLISFSIFTRRAFTGATLISALFVATAGSILYVLTLYMQQLLRFSPLQTGLAFLPMGLVVIVASNLVPNLVTRFGMKAGLIVANVLVIVGGLLLSRIGVHGNYWLDLLPGMLIFAAGAALILVASAMAVTTVQPHEQGIASGVLNTAQQIGLALGLAISVASMTASKSALTAAHVAPEMALVGGFGAGLLTNIVFVVLGAILSSILPVKEAAARR